MNKFRAASAIKKKLAKRNYWMFYLVTNNRVSVVNSIYPHFYVPYSEIHLHLSNRKMNFLIGSIIWCSFEVYFNFNTLCNESNKGMIKRKLFLVLLTIFSPIISTAWSLNEYKNAAWFVTGSSSYSWDIHGELVLVCVNIWPV